MGDWNPNLVQNASDVYLTVHNHVDFLTHESGASLNTVISNIPSLVLSCKPPSTVGTYDHNAVLIRSAIDVGEDKKSQDPLAVGWSKLGGCKIQTGTVAGQH